MESNHPSSVQIGRGASYARSVHSRHAIREKQGTSTGLFTRQLFYIAVSAFIFWTLIGTHGWKGSETTRGVQGQAPQEGFEPPTWRLTAACSAVELSGKEHPVCREERYQEAVFRAVRTNGATLFCRESLAENPGVLRKNGEN